MPNRMRDKGLRAERELAALLGGLTPWQVSRIPRPGAAHDCGDLFGIPLTVVQVADWPSDQSRAVLQKPREAEDQRARANVPFATSAVRFRGGDWRWCLTTPQWVDLTLAAIGHCPCCQLTQERNHV